MTIARITSITMILVSIAATACLVQNGLYNPSYYQGERLHYTISTLEPPMPYFLDTVHVDYTALKKTFTQRPALWGPLVPGSATQAPQAARPNFFAILNGVVPSKRKEMKAGEDIKVRVLTPARPLGQWMGVGDTIHGCTIIGFSPDHMIVEKHTGGARYVHRLPRK